MCALRAVLHGQAVFREARVRERVALCAEGVANLEEVVLILEGNRREGWSNAVNVIDCVAIPAHGDVECVERPRTGLIFDDASPRTRRRSGDYRAEFRRVGPGTGRRLVGA